MAEPLGVLHILGSQDFCFFNPIVHLNAMKNCKFEGFFKPCLQSSAQSSSIIIWKPPYVK